MTWQPYVLSIAVGLGVGALYGVLNVKAPAPPVIALLGLLGILVGEMAVRHLRGSPDAIAQCLHTRTFSPDKQASEDCKTDKLA